MSGAEYHDLVGLLRRRRISRRQFARKACALGASVSVIGAGLRAAPRVARAQESPVVAFWTPLGDPDRGILQGITDSYNASAQGHTVELVPITQTQVTDLTALRAAIAEGSGPDVYHLDRFAVPQYAAEGLIEDLSVFLGATKLTDSYIPFAAAEASFNGNPYALPFDTDARAIFYNRGLMLSSGIDPALLDSAEGPVTWNQLKQVANRVNKTDANGNYEQMGFVPWFDQGWHYTYGFSWGGEFFDQEACVVSPDDPNIVAAFQWVYDYCAELGPQQLSAFVVPPSPGGLTPDQHPFIQGRLAIQISTDAFINQLATLAPEMEYDVTYLPVPSDGDPSVTWAGGWSVVMPEGARHPDEAWQFMSYIAGADGQRPYVRESNHLPTWQTLLSESELFDERHRFFSERLLPAARNRPPLPVGALYWDELSAAWQRTYLNEEEPGVALASVKDRVQPQLAGFCPIAFE